MTGMVQGRERGWGDKGNGRLGDAEMGGMGDWGRRRKTFSLLEGMLIYFPCDHPR
jgi:hypothetical protein